MTAAVKIEPVGAVAADVLAALHRRCFAVPWGRDAFARLAALPGTITLVAMRPATPPIPVGFAVARVTADQAEILSLGVLPDDRRTGVGRALIEAAMKQAGALGAAEIFLEVEAGNVAAKALYATLDFTTAGRHVDYYRRRGANNRNAIILRRKGTGLTEPAAADRAAGQQ